MAEQIHNLTAIFQLFFCHWSSAIGQRGGGGGLLSTGVLFYRCFLGGVFSGKVDKVCRRWWTIP